jgi:hypothetical protein
MPYNARVTSKQTQMNIPITLEDKQNFVNKNETRASFLYTFFMLNLKQCLRLFKWQ